MAKNGKIGSEHAAAWMRAGFKEAAQALPAFPAHAIQPVEELGLAGNLPTKANTPEAATFQERLNLHRSTSPAPSADRGQDIER